MIENKYRLKDYIITEYDNLFYTWEMNIVLGEHHTGICFIIRDILVIHSLGHKKNGCLKLEYCEKLARLPVWTKTLYYCFSDSLKDVNKGKSLSNYLNQAEIEKEQYRFENSIFDENDEYQLNLYKIIVQPDGAISWEKYDGLNKINRGSCIIKSAILFIGSKLNEIDESQSKKEWINKLKLLPKWDRTFAWGHLRVLHSCKSGQETNKPESVIVKLGKVKEYLSRNGTVPSAYKKDKRGKRTTLQIYFHGLRHGLNLLEWVRGWLVTIKPITIEVLKTGLHFFLFTLKKIIFGIQRIIQYFRSR